MKPNSKNTKPVAIILADQPLGAELQTIFGRQDLSSLAVAGTSIVEHVLVELRDMKIHECIVLARENATQIQSQIGDVRRWGMNITVMKHSLSKEQVLREYKALSQPNGLLVIEANCLRSHCIKEFLNQAGNSEYSLLEAQSKGQAIGVSLLKATTADFIINAMPVELDKIMICQLNSTHEYHQANFDVVMGKYRGLEPCVQINSTVGQRQHWAANVHAKSKTYQGNVMIDRHCRVSKDVSLKTVILNHDVYVERNVSLENTIVMPNVIISAGKPIKNAIVNEDMVYQI